MNDTSLEMVAEVCSLVAALALIVAFYVILAA